MIAGANGERLGDLSRLDAQRLRRRLDGCGGVVSLDQAQVRRMAGVQCFIASFQVGHRLFFMLNAIW